MKRHIVVLFIGLVAMVSLGLYPPFVGEARTPRETRVLTAGYYSVFSPPKGEHRNTGRSEYIEVYHLDYTRLLVQEMGMLMLTCCIAHVVRPREPVELRRPRFDEEEAFQAPRIAQAG